MTHYIRICGPAGWGLLFVSLVVTVMVLHTAVSLARHGAGQHIKLRHRLHALIFWGFVGAVLGFLGQTSAIHQAMTVIIPAKAISPEMIDRGFRESFVPSFWGFGIFLTSAALYFVFRLILRQRSEKSSNGPSQKMHGLGAVSCALILLGTVSSPAFSISDRESETTGILTSSAWMGKAGPDDVVFRLWATGDGALSGEAHTIRGGKHMTQSPATRVIWDDPNLEMHMNTGVILQGKLDKAKKRIDGELIYGGKTLMELPLDGVDPNEIKGLLARPAPAPGEPLYSYSRPSETGDGWQPAGPEALGLEQAQLEALVTDIIDGKAGILHSIIIAHEGKLVLEEYFHGYERDDIHRLASVTKSVSSLIVGIAIDRGDISGVDAPLGDFFPQDEDLFKGEWDNVTLEHLLTMSIGTAWTEQEARRTHGAGDAFFRELLSRSFTHEPGEQWQYVSANVNLLGGVIKNTTGMHADEFAAAHLFRPLGIEDWNWDYGMVDGYRLMDGSLRLKPRDMAKLGALVADGGSWKETQIVSSQWIKESTSPQIPTSDGAPEKYGYLWWLFYIPTSSGIQEAVVANGMGSQFIVFFPTVDLVVVTTGSNDENGMQLAIGKLLSAHVLGNVAATKQ